MPDYSLPVSIAFVALGGALGSVLRYLGVETLTRQMGFASSAGILAVNVVGCLIAGALVGAWSGMAAPSSARLFVLTGVLGGFTTFSAFSVETLELLRSASTGRALSYVFLSTAGSIGAAAAGFRLFHAAS